MKKIYIIICIIFMVLLSNTCFSYDLNTWAIDNNKSIKELQENLNSLNQTKNQLNVEFFILNQNQKLKAFFKENLDDKDLENIEDIILNYLKDKNDVEDDIKEKILESLSTDNKKTELLELKKELYKALIPYIKVTQFDDYIEYIEQDVKILKEKLKLSDEMNLKNEIINSKISNIEEKIVEHRKYLNEKFTDLINTLIEEKINNLITNESFIKLSKEEQGSVIQKIIENIEVKINDLDIQADKTDVLSKKLEIYQKVYIKLLQLKEGL